jgi:UDP-glucose 4-epimerase
MKFLRRGLPLPFGDIANRRSFVDVSDLARLARVVLNAPAPPPIVLAASSDATATPVLVQALAEGMGVRPKLLNIPAPVLAGAAKMLGRAAMWQSLAGSFIANPQAATQLGWAPTHTLRESLIKTGQSYTVS